MNITANEGVDDSSDTASKGQIYHEKQSKQLCALHALNNLFQDPKAFTKQDLNMICKELAPEAGLFNPHRSVLGLGCYDVNVIISALSKKGFDVIWFDKRKEPSRLNLDQIFGFILNVPNSPSYGLFAIPLNYIPSQIWSSQKHWVAIKKIENNYYNLDSKLISPICIGNDESLLEHIQMYRNVDQVEILIVVDRILSEDQVYLKFEHRTKE